MKWLAVAIVVASLVVGGVLLYVNREHKTPQQEYCEENWTSPLC